ncbi:MAG: type II secretion system protein GspM [Leptospiraceae bacterium]|nr:type II secretion system protein GspM [Leptospiraceae bacterium]MDW7976023.1 type II secretion system protein GspM [Leptospiraceae bacterium]
MWNRLSPREKLLLVIVVIILFILGLAFVFQIIIKKQQEIESSIEKKRKDLQTLVRLKNQISAIPKIPDIPDKNELLTIITQKLQEKQITPNSIRDREEKTGKTKTKTIFVDMSFNGIALPPFWEFLYEIEYQQRGVKIKELVIRKPLPGRDIFDVRLTLYVEKME